MASSSCLYLDGVARKSVSANHPRRAAGHLWRVVPCEDPYCPLFDPSSFSVHLSGKHFVPHLRKVCEQRPHPRILARNERIRDAKKNMVKAVVFGAALALVIPGIASASTTATVAAPAASSWTSPGNGALLKSNAQCDSGLVSSGGLNVTNASGDTNQQKGAVHIMETTPSNDGLGEEDGTNVDDTYWLG